jgi:Phage integrase, N-terminal SAM-like domain
MTKLRQRMIDAMVQRGFAVRTQQCYVRAIRRMAKHYRRDPALYTQQEVQGYLLHMVKEDKLSYSSMNQAACGVADAALKPAGLGVRPRLHGAGGQDRCGFVPVLRTRAFARHSGSGRAWVPASASTRT